MTLIVRELIAFGANIEFRNYESRTALIIASGEGHVGVVKELIRCRADVNVYDRGNWTALMLTVNSQNKPDDREKIVKMLVVAGANLNARNHLNLTALLCATHNNMGKVIAYLLREGADDSVMDYNGETAFQVAVRQNRPYAVQDAWDEMKGRMNESKVDTVLLSAVVANNTLEVEDEAPLAAFLREVPNAMIMMEGIMSFLIGPMDPRFL